MYTLQKPLLGTQINWAHPLSKGLVGCWIFNEGGGNKIYDLGGNNNHGTLINIAFPPTATSGWGPGKFGPALKFDGTNDHLNCGNNSSLNNIQTAFAFTAWVTFNQVNRTGTYLDWQTFFAKNVYNAWFGLMLDTGTADKRLRFYHSGLSYADSTYNWTWVQPNVWYFLAVTYDGSCTKHYINAELKLTTSVSGTQTTNTNVLLLGRSGSHYPFDGIMDNVCIYNRAPSTAEIWQLNAEPYCMFAPTYEEALLYAPPPAAVMNPFQKANLGADLYDGVLIP